MAARLSAGPRARARAAGRLLALVAIAAAATPASSARAETRPGDGGQIAATLIGEPVTLDPVAARTHAELTVVGLVFDTLYRGLPDGTVEPHLAAAPPEVSDDGRVVRITLRAGVTFHDGTALDAIDVVASLRRLAKSDAGWLLAPVEEIGRDGATVVTLSLRAPTPELTALLAAPQASITPGGQAPKARAPVGSGPFRIDTIDRGKRRVVLVASDDHFRGRPHLDRVELRWFAGAGDEARWFEDGKLQLSERGATAFAGAQPKYKADVVEGPATLLTFVGFGTAHAKITGDRDLRRALNLAIARRGLESLGAGERISVTTDPLPADLGGEPLADADRKGDLDGARAALARAAKRVSALGTAARASLKLEILVDQTRFDDREVADKLVVALDKLGLGAEITELPAGEFATRVARGECDLYVGQLPALGADPALLWAAAFAAGGDAWARGQLAGGAVDVGAARREFADRLPVLPLFHRALRVHHRTDVRGLVLDASARIGFADLFTWGAPARSKGRGR